MSDTNARPDATSASDVPQYRVRVPEAGTATPKSAENAADPVAEAAASTDQPNDDKSPDKPKEIGGPKGPEPTRFGDWERDGRCVDF